jgi:hypothetical protein
MENIRVINHQINSTTCRKLCVVLKKHTPTLCTNTHFNNLIIMIKHLGDDIWQISDKEKQMITDGLDLLDEYYSTELMPDEVLRVRSIKSIIRSDIPTNILN